jgi:hypothetical protein
MIFSIIMVLTKGLTTGLQNLSILHAPFLQRLCRRACRLGRHYLHSVPRVFPIAVLRSHLNLSARFHAGFRGSSTKIPSPGSRYITKRDEASKGGRA